MTAEHVLLWRHGRTAYNQDSRFQGQSDIPLDEVGAEQVQRGARLIAGQLEAFGHPAGGPVRLMTSDLVRARDTAAALTAVIGVPAEPDVRLREINAGSWEGMLAADIRSTWPEDHAAWRRGDDIKIGGGETRSEAAARAVACISEAAESMDGGTLICASHGGTLRGAMFMLLGWPRTSWNAIEGLRNAHWAQLQGMSFGWRLSGYNLGGVIDEYERSPETGEDVLTAR